MNIIYWRRLSQSHTRRIPTRPSYDQHRLLSSFGTDFPLDDNLSSNTTTDELSLNQELRHLVASGLFSAAERTRLKLASNGLRIEPQPEYARVALGCLRARRLSGETGKRKEEFETWLQLIPDRESLSLVQPNNFKSPFSTIIYELTHRSAPPKYLPLLTLTGHSLSSKGYARYHFASLARLIILNSLPNSPHIEDLIIMEDTAAEYEKDYEKPWTPIACYIRCALIELFVQRGWSWKGVGTIMKERPFAIPDTTYQVVLDGIKGTRYATSTRKVLKRWREDKVEALLGSRLG